MTDQEHDGIWRAERVVSGSWIAARYIDHGPGLNHRYERQQDIQMIKGHQVPNYYDALSQCSARCEELNKRTVARLPNL